MRVSIFRPAVTAALLAAAAAALWPSSALGLDALWPTDVNAQGHRLKGLALPGAGADALRLQDMAIGTCLLKATGVNVPTFVCGADGTDFLSPATGLLLGAHAATSVVGRAAGSSGNAADITATADGQLLQRVSGSLTWASTLPGTSVTGTPNTVAYFNGSGLLNSLTLAPEFTLTTGALSLTANGVGNAKLATAPASSIKGNATGSTATVQDVAAGAANLVPVSTASGWGWSVVPAVATNGIVANWPIANARYFAIDGTSGSDANVCYSDTSMADAGTKACATISGLVAKFPSLGAGRIAIIDIRRGTYTEALGQMLSGVTGYAGGFPVIRGTGDLASAGATAFANDTADSIALGAVTAAGMNAAGYTPKAGATTQVIPLTQLGGADPGFPAESTVPLPLGARIRFSSTTSTVALRNVARTIVQITGTDTVSVPIGNQLPAAPTTSDLAFIETPGVNLPASIIVGYSGSGQLVGLNFTGNLSVRAGAGGPSLAFTDALAAIATDASLTMASTYTTNVNGFAVGGSRTSGNVSATRSPLAVHEAAVGGTLTVTQGQSLSVDSNAVMHDVFLSGSGTGPQTGGAFTFGGIFNSDYVRVLSNSGGVAFSIFGTKVQINNVKFSDGQFAYAFDLRGKNDVMLIGDITVPIAGVGVIGFGQTRSTGWKLDNATNSTLTFLNYQAGGTGLAYQVTGADGDFRLPVPAGIGCGLASYADLAKVGSLLDTAGNRIVFGSSNLDMVTAAPTAMAMCVGNSTGADIPAGSIVQIGGGGVNLAQGDTEAHLAGPLAVTITAVKNGFSTFKGYAVAHIDNYRPILDGTISWPSPLYVSATTPGAVTSAAPGPGRPTRRIGNALDTLAVRFEPEMGTIFDQQVVNNTTLLTQRTRLRCDGTTIVCSDDGTNFWTNAAVGAIPEASITGLTSDLASKLTDSGSNGIVVRTGLGTTVSRTLTNTDGTITITNPNGVAGNPIINATGVTPSTRTVTGTAPIGIAGDHAAHDLSADRTWALDPNGVTYPFLQQGAALSIPGRASASTGSWADIVTAPGSGAVLRESGSTIGFGNIAEAAVTNLVSDLANKAITARTISTTAPLTGGGDLSVDRTLGITDFVASGGGHARGAVPDPGSTAGTTRFLREDGWSGLATVAQTGSASDLGTGTLPDARLSNTIAAGSCTNCNVSYDTHGRLVSAASGPAAFSATAARIPYGSGIGGGFTDSANLTYVSNALTLGSANGSAIALDFTGGTQVIQKDGTGDFWLGTGGAQSLRMFVGNTHEALDVNGTTFNVDVLTNLSDAGVAANSLVKTNGSHVFTAATGTDVTNAVTWPGGVLQGAGGGLSSFSVTNTLIPYGAASGGGLATDSALSYAPADHALFIQGSRASDGAAIILGKSGVQAIQKEGTGDLFVGTSTAYGFDIYTNNATRLVVDSLGNLRLNHYGAGMLMSDASGNVTSNALPGASFLLVSQGPGTVPGSDSTMSADTTNHVLFLDGARASDGAAVVLGKSGIQAIQKEGTGDLFIGTSTAYGLQLYTGNSTRLAIDNAGVVKIANLTGTGTRCVHVDSTGILSPTASDCGTGSGGGVTGVTATAPLASSGGTAPNITLNASGVSAGTYVIGNGFFTVDGHGLITNAAGATAYTASSVNGGGTVAGSQLNFVGPFTETISSGIATITLASKVAATSSDSSPDYLVNKLTSSSGNVVVTNIGGAQVNLNVDTTKTAQTALPYTFQLYATLNPGEGVSGGLSPNASGSIGVVQTEYPAGFAASTATVSCYLQTNLITGGTYTIKISRNGADTSAAIGYNSSSTVGLVAFNNVTVGSPSVQDRWGLDFSTVGTAGSHGGGYSAPDLMCTLVLQP